MKAISATEILRKNAPREFLGRNFAHNNRFDFFREPSPAPSNRSRLGSTASIKRKEEYYEECDDIPVILKKGKLSEEEVVNFACMESNITKVSNLCNKITMDIQESDESDKAKSIMSDLCEAIKTISQVQSELVKKVYNTEDSIQSTSDGKFSYSAVAANGKSAGTGQPTHTRRLPAGGLVRMSMDKQGKPSQVIKVTDEPVETPEETKKRKFVEAIKEAERSTLCFNLDMGNVPLINKVTIQEKASLALTSMAAKKESKNSAIPSSDAIAAIDDFTSMVTSMDFYGSNTKQYKGNTDKPFCTVPVRYQFKDRDVRTFAEKTLRDTCGVQCSTPYPTIVREAIKQVVAHVKKSHPDEYVKVNVLTKEFCLKVARRPKGKDQEWTYYTKNVPLPDLALDINCRKVPEGFRLEHLPEEDEVNDVEMSSTESSPKKSKQASSPKKTTVPALLKGKK
jgi:hypothetical protein